MEPYSLEQVKLFAKQALAKGAKPKGEKSVDALGLTLQVVQFGDVPAWMFRGPLSQENLGKVNQRRFGWQIAEALDAEYVRVIEETAETMSVTVAAFWLVPSDSTVVLSPQ